MSHCTISAALERIKAASFQSPIAVFRSNVPGCVETKFANTITTQQEISKLGSGLLGVYHKGDDPVEVRRDIIRKCAGESTNG